MASLSGPREHLRALAEASPADGTVTVPVKWLREICAEPVAPLPPTPTWKERLWQVGADTRLSVKEAAEALGKSPQAVYKMLERHQLPATRLPNGTIMFKASDLRRYLEGRKTAA